MTVFVALADLALEALRRVRGGGAAAVDVGLGAVLHVVGAERLGALAALRRSLLAAVRADLASAPFPAPRIVPSGAITQLSPALRSSGAAAAPSSHEVRIRLQIVGTSCAHRCEHQAARDEHSGKHPRENARRDGIILETSYGFQRERQYPLTRDTLSRCDGLSAHVLSLRMDRH